eukprot:TRINITY_DN5282_c0_g1_i1.p1 TRINITY_DN5282_c0_g1~~TRINITY_DN5282_c0_g1_i1.p1  ORF type:complete len:439 (+),score=101.68 TRINITY_DN5282_c0_g1_i1:104-1318(+)
MLRSVPSGVLPLSLGILNVGAMWSQAGGPGGLTTGMDSEGLKRAMDTCAGICIALQLLYAAKISYVLVWRRDWGAFWAEYKGSIPAWTGGDMALMGIAAWAHLRGAETFAQGLWAAALCMHAAHMFTFVVVVACRVSERPAAESPQKATSIPEASPASPTPHKPEQPYPDNDTVPPPSAWRRLWDMLDGSWFVPVVGIAAASATGNPVVGPTTESALRRAALFGPVYAGIAWNCVALVPIAAKLVAARELWAKPTSAVLIAPTALCVAGWIGVAGAEYDLAEHWLTHLLVAVACAVALPTLPAVAMLLDPRRPFTPGLAACTFPMDIVAIALIRYHKVIRGRNGADVFRIAAWAQLGLATAAVVLVAGRYALAGLRALLADPEPDPSAAPAVYRDPEASKDRPQ